MLWNAPPRKGEAVHDSKFVEDIRIVKIKSDVSTQLCDTSKPYRSSYDPRVVANRVTRSITSFDLDQLAQVTNGKTGLLLYSKVKADPLRASPNFNEIEHIVEVSTSVEALTVSEAVGNISRPFTSTELISELSIDSHQQNMLAHNTSQQALSQKWLDHRKGRVTSSVAGECAAAVSGTPPAFVKSIHSCVARIMGYYGNPTSPALQWGKDHEAMARKHYAAHHRLHRKHTGVSCSDTGLWISTKFPFIAASPDGIVTCKVCGDGLVEIKNPYKNRKMTISELVHESESSGLICENNVIHLDRKHRYYDQIQTQLFAAEYEWCDFVVHTSATNDNIHVERIFLDRNHLDILLPKLLFFFSEAITPELLSGQVRDRVKANAEKRRQNKQQNTTTPLLLNDSLYRCGVCGDVCDDDPIDDSYQSVGCDLCHVWYHFICVRLTGEEAFLKRRNSSWKCDKCKRGSRKRKQ